MKFLKKLEEIWKFWNTKTPEIPKNATKNAMRKFELSFIEMFVNYNELKILNQIGKKCWWCFEFCMNILVFIFSS